MTELPGQMTLFTLDGCTDEVQAGHADELCEECGGWCTASTECVTDLAYNEDVFHDGQPEHEARSEW